MDQVVMARLFHVKAIRKTGEDFPDTTEHNIRARLPSSELLLGGHRSQPRRSMETKNTTVLIDCRP